MKGKIMIERMRHRMRLSFAAWLGLVTYISMAIIVPAAPSDAAETAFKVARAVNIAQWFTWPRYQGNGIAWPPYKNCPAPPTVDQLKTLKQAGFDTVRLPVDPAPFIVLEGNQREAVYDILFDALARIKAAGLRTIVDIHPNSAHPVWGQNAVATGLEFPAFLAAAGFAEQLARHFTVADRAWIALELLNEPRLKCTGTDQDLWQKMVQYTVRRVRAVNPAISLVVSGACSSSVVGLLALDPAPFHDPNILYTFHFYDPFSFTHQGAQFIRWPDKYLDGVPWPASARDIAEPLALMDRRVASTCALDEAARAQARNGALNNLKRFYASGAGPEMIRAQFAEVRAWADRHGIAPAKILNGEFGVIRRSAGKPGAFCQDRMRWLRDVREASERQGFAWAYFSYDGPFALLAEGDDNKLDPAVLASLGLPSPCTQTGAVSDPAASNATGGCCAPEAN